MKYEPYPYQAMATDFIIRTPRCALHSKIGSGKTAIVLDAVVRLIKELEVNRVLIIAPLKVIEEVFPPEMQKWDNIRGISFDVLHGKMRHDWILRNSFIHLINYEGLKWFLRSKDRPFYDMVILDESHWVKSHRTKRFSWLQQFLKSIPRVVLMTGSPLGNTLLDLWAQYNLLDGGKRLFSSYDSFKNFYFMKEDSRESNFTWLPRPGTQNAIALKVQDITYQVPSSHVKRPPMKESVIYCDMSAADLKRYKKFEREFLLNLEDHQIEAFNAASLVNKLRQYASGFMYLNEQQDYKIIHTTKYDALDDYVHRVGEPIMLVTQFRAEIEILRKMYPGLQTIRGKDSKTAVRKAIRAWNNGEIDMLAIHPRAAGTGLNIQGGGRRQLWLSPDWSFLATDQTIGRVRRIGQMKDVIIDYFVTRDTIEEAVIKAVKNKARTLRDFEKILRQYKDKVLRGELI